MRYLSLMMFFILNSCVHHNQIQDLTPYKTIIDANNGHPLSGVQVIEIKPGGKKEQVFVTTVEGRISYSDVISSKAAQQHSVPGAEKPNIQTFSLNKQGYHATKCSCKSGALFSNKKNAKIPLLKVSEPTTVIEPAIFLSVGESDIVCQIFIGSSVSYEGQRYSLKKINRREECGFEYIVLTLVSEKGKLVDVSEINSITLTNRY